MEEPSEIFFSMIDKERNIYELSNLINQKRKKIESYLDILQDPLNGQKLSLKSNHLTGSRDYEILDNIPNFTNILSNSIDWKRLNKQFLNYHRSLSTYSLLNALPILNYLSIQTGIADLKNIKVLDVGGGTGHTFVSFFKFPETIDYFLLDPNIRLLHDQFLRVYPKLSYLEMSHILANAENLPIVDNSFDVVLSLSAVDHLDDYKKFISESFRVLKAGGKFLISSHLDIPPNNVDKTNLIDKLFSQTFWERISRKLYLRKHHVGTDDHTLHLENEKPIEHALLKSGFKIEKKEIFKRYFYFVAEK